MASPTWGNDAPLDPPISPSEEVSDPMPAPELSPEAERAIDHLAAKQGKPVENYAVGYEHPRVYPLLNRRFMAVTLVDIEEFRSVRVLLDEEGDEILDDLSGDVEALEAEEAARYIAKYGKLQILLFERLETAQEDELLPVAIWAAGRLETPEELYAIVAVDFPEAAEAVERGDLPFEVEDEEHAQQIQDAYQELLRTRADALIEGIVIDLRARSAEVQTFDGMPTVTTSLTKADIAEFAQREDVARIFLIEQEGEPALDAAIPTDRIAPIWVSGLTGLGRKIAILEGNTVVSNGYLNLDPASRGGYLGTGGNNPNHATQVAGAAAGNHPTYRGVAYNATILGAGVLNPGDQPATLAALDWSIQRDPDVTNASWVYYTNNSQLDWIDIAFDHRARYQTHIITVAAGNWLDQIIAAPGKGWNVITVGGSNPGGNYKWADDGMCVDVANPPRGSSYFNPAGNGRIKPEVTAPGQGLLIPRNNGAVGSSVDGKSFATPQVSGLAALLIHRNSLLRTRPTAVKAILMASAVHNIEGDRRLSTRDGAGNINGALADGIAQNYSTANTCYQPCWWSVNTTASSPPQWGIITRQMQLARSERVRVAISWYSTVSTPLPYPTLGIDQVGLKLNLHVYSPSGTLVASSTSQDNNYEIVEFVASQSGTYEIRVQRTSAHGETNLLGIAWTRQSAYLPYIPTNSGWSGNVYVRNDGAQSRGLNLRYSNGTLATATLNPNGWYNSTAPGGLQLTALLDGNQDLTLVTRQINTNRSILDNAFLNTGVEDWAFERAAPTLFGPAFYKNMWGFNSEIHIQNVGTQSTNITVHFYGRSGQPDPAPYTFNNVTPNARVVLNTSHINPSSWVGSVRIVSPTGQPLAAKFLETRNPGSINIARSYNGAAGGNTLIYVAAAYKNMWNFNTGLVIQNLDASSSTNINLLFCPRNVVNPPGGCHSHAINGIGPRRAVGLNLNDVNVGTSWTGSISITSSNGRPLAAAINNDRMDGSGTVIGGYNFNAVAAGGRYVYLPYAAKNADGFTTGYTIRNISGGTVTVIARYYNANGTLAWSSPTMTVSSAQSTGRFQSDDTGIPNGWQGSIVLEASGDIVAVMRADGTNTISGYNGIVRR